MTRPATPVNHPPVNPHKTVRMARGLAYFSFSLMADFFLISISFVAAFYCRHWLAGLFPRPPATMLAWPEPGSLYLLGISIILASFLFEGMYSTGFNRLDRTEQTVKSLSWSFFLILLITFIIHTVGGVSRLLLFINYLVLLLIMVLVRPLVDMTLIKRLGLRISLRIMDKDLLDNNVLEVLTHAGFEPVSDPQDGGQSPMETALIGFDPQLHQQIWIDHERNFREVGIVPMEKLITTYGAKPVNLRGTQIFVISHPLRRRVNRFIKRGIDLAVSGTLAVILIPLGMFIALLVWLDSPGPVLFGRVSLGKDWKPFKAWKFRTMVMDADSRLEQLLANDPQLSLEYHASFKLKKDPRLTRLGKWLRRYSLDELPQLWNVLCGQMSLVGPRAIAENEISIYGPVRSITNSVRPGITGLWQTSGRSDTSYSSRRNFDLYYIRNWTIWLDLALLVKTLQAVILPGAY